MKAYLQPDIKSNDPSAVYWVINPTRSKIFNFHEFTDNSHVKAFCQNNSILQYNYEGSDFIDKDPQLLVTGDFPIIKNDKLRKLATKEPKYKENNNISPEKRKLSLVEYNQVWL